MNYFDDSKKAAVVTTISQIISFPYCFWIYVSITQNIDVPSYPHHVYDYSFHTRHYYVILINSIIGVIQLYGVARKKSIFTVPWLLWMVIVLIGLISLINKMDREHFVVIPITFVFYSYSLAITFCYYEMMYERERIRSSSSKKNLLPTDP